MSTSLPPQPERARQAAQKHMTAGSWLNTFKASWHIALYLDRASLTPFQALRSVLGVGIPLLLGIIMHQEETGVLIASGGLLLGSIGLKDPYQKRAQTMFVACLFVMLSALVGGIVGGFGWWPVLLAVGLWGFIAGMVASISPTAQVVAIQACSALIVYTHLQLDPFHALLVAGAVGIGTLFQFLLAIVPSPWTNTLPERSALATIYQNLGQGAASPSEQKNLAVAEALLTGHTTLLNSNTRSEKGQMFARLLEEAEHVRLTLFVLRRQQHQFALCTTEPILQSASTLLDQLIRESGPMLEYVARALRSPSSLVQFDERARAVEMKETVRRLRELTQSAEAGCRLEQILPYCTALLGELHIVCRLALTWRRARQYWPVHLRLPYPRPSRLYLEDIRTNIRANLTPRSSAFRHAVRLSVALLLATVLYQVFHLSVARGYWIPMTTALVLRSDFITTFARGVARLLGTVLGAVLTTLLVVLLSPSPGLLMALTILTSYVMFATLFANYVIFSVGTTMTIAFLLSFTNAPTIMTAADRALDTTIGGILALLIYALWPTWEQFQVPENIARRLEMLGRYFSTMIQEYTDPAYSEPQTVAKRHRESRLARSNALGSVQRSLQEPAAHRVDAELAQGLLAAADNVSRSILTLEAYLYDNPPRHALPAVQNFADTVETALDHLATAIRLRQSATLPDTQAALQQLKAASRATKRPSNTPQQQGRFIIEEAKRIVVYLQAMQQLLTMESFA